VTEVDEDVRFERDSEWLSRHHMDLQADYSNKYVAVLDKRVVGVGDDGEKLYVEVVGKYGETQSLISLRMQRLFRLAG
jgi:hypothetical protein